MSIPTVNVLVTVHEQDGSPAVGAQVIAKLMTTERYNGFVVPDEYSGVTNDDGNCTISLFPNELGTEGSEYKFKIIHRNGKTVNVFASIPNYDCSLHQISELDRYELRGAGHVVTSEIIGYVNETKTARDNARAAELGAANHSISAGEKAATATEQANIATAKASEIGANAKAAADAAAYAATSISVTATNATNANTARVGAEAARDLANTHKVDAQAARDKAKLWADQSVDVPVETGKYSAKHHSTKAAGSADSAMAARDAATTKASEAASSATTALGYANEAKGHVTTAATHATNAEASKNAAAVSASVASTNASTATTKADAATASANNAATSATAASVAKVGAESARDTSIAYRDEALAARNKAQSWASAGEDIIVEGTEYSAKHHATKASKLVATLLASEATTISAKNTAVSAANSATTSANTATTKAAEATSARDAAALSATQAGAAKDIATTKATEAANSAAYVADVIDNGVPQATTTVRGTAKIATIEEVQAGENDTNIVTPLKLKQYVGDSANTDEYIALFTTNNVETLELNKKYIIPGNISIAGVPFDLDVPEAGQYSFEHYQVIIPHSQNIGDKVTIACLNGDVTKVFTSKFANNDCHSVLAADLRIDDPMVNAIGEATGANFMFNVEQEHVNEYEFKYMDSYLYEDPDTGTIKNAHTWFTYATIIYDMAKSGHTHDIWEINNLEDTLDSLATKYPVTTTTNGLMLASDKVKLDGIATGANNYTHPTTDGNKHVPANGTTNNGKFLKAGSTAGLYTWANIAATDITTDASNRFVSDTDKTNWNAKPSLGETSATAYRGDRGKTAYDHAISAHAPSNALTPASIGVTVQGYSSKLATVSDATAEDGDVMLSSKTQVVKNKEFQSCAESTVRAQLGGIHGELYNIVPANGPVQLLNIYGNVTISINDWLLYEGDPILNTQALTLMVYLQDDCLVTWPEGINWSTGTPPTVGSTGAVIELLYVDNLVFGFLSSDNITGAAPLP